MKCQISSTIDLLTNLGAEATLTEQTALFDAIENSDISSELKALIHQNNGNELLKKLELEGYITSVIIVAPEDDEDEQEEQSPDQTEENVRNFA